MEDEKMLTEQESLELITRMINKAKNDYTGTGVSGLLWGAVISLCGLLSFFNYYLRWEWLSWIWLLTFIAVIPQVVLAAREKRKRRFTRYQDDAMGGIWLSFAIAMGLLFYFDAVYNIPKGNTVFLILYGIPTFATGYAVRFRPMLLGGIACWVFAIVSTLSPYPYTMLYTVAAGQLAWFIPGLILRRRYLKAKRQHV